MAERYYGVLGRARARWVLSLVWLSPAMLSPNGTAMNDTEWVRPAAPLACEAQSSLLMDARFHLSKQAPALAHAQALLTAHCAPDAAAEVIWTGILLADRARMQRRVQRAQTALKALEKQLRLSQQLGDAASAAQTAPVPARPSREPARQRSRDVIEEDVSEAQADADAELSAPPPERRRKRKP